MRIAADGGSFYAVSDDIPMMVILGAVYSVIFVVMFRMFER